jgi:16S rRNA (adenine1518-N6/adenine1519-N6)-dimethyltransferase
MSDDLPPLREVIARHDLGANKAFGQHFLLDLNITRKIARAGAAGAGDTIIEVGPGPGGLTRALLETGAAVIAVERDRRFIPALEELQAAFPGALTIVETDALHADERALAYGAGVKIVSNLPYNISTELLVKWLIANHAAAPLWTQMTLMFQKEVADRILAPPGSKTYGRLSVIAQAASRPRRAFDLPARAFTPPPKVASTVVAFEPAPTRLTNIAALEQVTQAAFSQRRKMLRSSLKPLFGADTERRLEAIGIAPTKRAEEISVEDFLRLAA